MRRAKRACVLLVLSASCGAAPAPAPDGVTLRVHPEVGARYEVDIVLDTHIEPLHGRVRTISHGELEIAAVQGDVVTYRSRSGATRLEMPDNPVRLPPVAAEAGCDVELRVGPRGELLASPIVVSGACPSAELAVSWVEALLPPDEVRVGDTWPLPAPGVAAVADAPTITREGSVELARVDGALADLEWQSSGHVGPLTPREGVTISATHETHGSASIAIADGLTRRGESHTTSTYDATPEDAARYRPTAIDVAWCLARQGEPPCEARVEETDARPSAQVYEGEACAARAATLDATLATIGSDVEQIAAGDVPTAERGTVPLTDSAPRIIVTAEGAHLDGRAVTPEQLTADLETLSRNWTILHPHTAFPGRVHLLAAPATPLSAIEPVLALLTPTHAVDMVVITGPGPTRPALPAWVGELPADPAARATHLSRAWTTAVSGCAPMISMFGALAMADASSRGALLRQGVGEALAACHCGGVDVDAIEALAARTGSTNDVAIAALVIPAGTTGRALRIARSGTAADLAAALAARTTPGSAVRLVFR